MTQEENMKAIVDDWWNSLDQFEQGEIIDDNYPNSNMPDVDEGWYYLDLKIKIEIYRENNPGNIEPDFDEEYHSKKEEG